MYQRKWCHAFRRVPKLIVIKWVNGACSRAKECNRYNKYICGVIKK